MSKATEEAVAAREKATRDARPDNRLPHRSTARKLAEAAKADEKKT